MCQKFSSNVLCLHLFSSADLFFDLTFVLAFVSILFHGRGGASIASFILFFLLKCGDVGCP